MLGQDPAATGKHTQLEAEKILAAGQADDFWVWAYGPMIGGLRQDDNLATFR